MKTKIELHQAWMWDCPDCGTENFCRAVTADLTPEEAIEMGRKLGHIDEFSEVPDDYHCGFVTQPDEVMCKNCDHFFEVDFHAEDDE